MEGPIPEVGVPMFWLTASMVRASIFVAYVSTWSSKMAEGSEDRNWDGLPTRDRSLYQRVVTARLRNLDRLDDRRRT